MRITLAGALLAASCVVASAQPAPTVRVKGTIEKVDGNVLTLKTAAGEEKLTLTGNAQVVAVLKASMADIKENTFLGSAAMPQADGSQKALEVHIFPEAMRGTGEGHRPWDLQPGSTMTNATVAQMVKAVDGQTITLKYKDGEKKIFVPKEAPIVTFDKADRSDLKAGAHVMVVAAKQPDGSFTANRVLVGKNGLVPPM